MELNPFNHLAFGPPSGRKLVRTFIRITFSVAPLQSRTVGFPESGSDLGNHIQAFPYNRRLKCWYTYSPITCRFTSMLVLNILYSSVSITLELPKCPEALRPMRGVTLIRSIIYLYLRRHYISLIATTTSCASPKSSCQFLSCLLYDKSLLVCTIQFEVGPSRRYL